MPHGLEDSSGEDSEGPFLPTARSWQAGEHGRSVKEESEILMEELLTEMPHSRNTRLPLQDHTALLERPASICSVIYGPHQARLDGSSRSDY